MATRTEEWNGLDTSIAEIEHELAALREESTRDGLPNLRTSVLTHVAWVPPEWEEAAIDTLAGLAERHPSRAILLHPHPEADEDALDARVSLRCFALESKARQVCCEVIELRLRGQRAVAPASVVTPLAITDLPVFLRWRGRPDFGASPFEGMVELVDRLVVDSAEWPDLPEAYTELAEIFERTAVSDIAWARALPWRREVAQLWPGIAEARELRVAGPRADALLLAGWLRSRLGREVALTHDDAAGLESVALDGRDVPRPRGERPTASDLLSDELEQFGRDHVYEAAVRAAGSERAP
ncbi:MAG: glucose-6-phosphate dehydrogenase assembly protein OpcA [Gaiellaceae bacterium]